MSQAAPFQVFDNPFGEIIKGFADLTDTLSLGSNVLGKTVEDLGFGKQTKDTKKLGKASKGLFSGLKMGLMGASGPIGLLVAALQALGFLQPIMTSLSALVSILSIGFAPILDIILELIFSLIPVFEGVSAVIEPLANILSNALMPIINMLTPIFAALMQVFFALMPIVLPLVQIFLDLFMAFTPIQPLLIMVVPLLLLLAEAITLLVPPILFVVDIITKIVGMITEAVTGVFTFVGEFFGNFFTNITGWITGGFDNIGEFFRELPKKVLDSIIEGFNDALDNLADLDIGGRIKDTVTGWFS